MIERICVRVSKDKLKDKKQELKHSLPDVNEKKILASFLAHLQKKRFFTVRLSTLYGDSNAPSRYILSSISSDQGICFQADIISFIEQTKVFISEMNHADRIVTHQKRPDTF